LVQTAEKEEKLKIIRADVKNPPFFVQIIELFLQM